MSYFGDTIGKCIVNWDDEKSTELNWLITCKAGKEVFFHLEADTVEATTVKVGKHDIDTYRANFKEIHTRSGKRTNEVDENGWYDVPFWAKKSFIAMMRNASGEWISCSYLRTEDAETGLNDGDFEQI